MAWRLSLQLGIIASCLVALSVAYMQRKQMRQIEAHRLDSSVPLKPPAHPIWAWLRRNGQLLILILPIAILIGDLRSTQPITRVTILDIAFNVSFITLAIDFYVHQRMAELFLNSLSLVSGIMREMHRQTGELTGIVKEIVQPDVPPETT